MVNIRTIIDNHTVVNTVSKNATLEEISEYISQNSKGWMEE
jgi:hypothetical protein